MAEFVNLGEKKLRNSTNSSYELFHEGGLYDIEISPLIGSPSW